MKLTSLIVPGLVAAGALAYLVVTNPGVAITTPAIELEHHIASSAATLDNSFQGYPISQEITRDYSSDHPDVAVRVFQNGNLDGLAKFCRAETSMILTSRPILNNEIALCNRNEIRYIEIPIALSASLFIVNQQNPTTNLTGAQIIQLWDNQLELVSDWHTLDLAQPERHLDIFGPQLESTDIAQLQYALWSDYNHSVRTDYTQLDNYPGLISSISTNRDAIAMVDYAFYTQNHDNVRAISINGVSPTPEHIRDGSYPYTHYLILYVNADALVNPEIDEFVENFILKAGETAEQFHYVALNEEAYSIYMDRLNHNAIGTAFFGKMQSGTSINEATTTPLCCGTGFRENG